MQILEARTQHWTDESACAASAGALARHAELRDAFIELHGPLGAGKTTFVRHLLRALGETGRVKSPTYALLEPYELPARGDSQPATAVWHFDFYRLHDPQEWEDAGFRDVFAGPGLKLVEWPERAAALLPPCDLRIELEPGDAERRTVRWSACTPRGIALLR